MLDFSAKLKRLIRWAKITKPGADSASYPVQQVTYMGKVADCVMVFPFGYHANLTAESLVTMFSVEADEANRAGIGWTPTNRPKLAAGEVAVYSPDKGTIIKFLNNGDLDVQVNGNSTVNITGDITVNITGNSIITVVGDATLKAAAITLDSDVSVTGTLDVVGDTTLGNVTSNGKNIGNTHTHSGVTPGVGVSGPVV